METMNTEVTPAVKNMEAYFNSHDTIYVAERAVFKNMGTGEETRGRKAIADMLNFMYHVAFDAHAAILNTVVKGNKALLEATFTGRHIGEFAGLAPTNKQVSVPLCVSYDLDEEGLIKEARIYMMGEVLLQQLRSD